MANFCDYVKNWERFLVSSREVHEPDEGALEACNGLKSSPYFVLTSHRLCSIALCSIDGYFPYEAGEWCYELEENKAQKHASN